MAKLRELDALQKRDLLASAKASPDELSTYARLYFEQELYYDAFRFFDRAGDHEGLADCKRAAIESADHELLWLLGHSPNIEVSDDDWRHCAERAVEIEKHTVAKYIYGRLGDSQALAELGDDESASTDESTERKSEHQTS